MKHLLLLSCANHMLSAVCLVLVGFFVSNVDYFSVHSGVETSSGLLYASNVPLQV